MLIRRAEPQPSGDDCAIAVMAKASQPGRTKTRLVPPLTFDEAAQFNTAFLQDVAENLRAAGERRPIAGYMAFGPPGAASFFEERLPGRLGLIETWFPNFGDNLFHAASSLLALGHGSACLLNADSPTLPTSLLVEAADLLARPGDRAVLGPSSDGGYYLLGLKHAHRRLFEEVDWSTERVAVQTLERAREIGLDVHTLPPWYDVDDLGTLRTLHDELFAGQAGQAFGDGVSRRSDLKPSGARHTAALMRALLADRSAAIRLGLCATPTLLEGLA